MPKPSLTDPLKSGHIKGQNPATPERLPAHTGYYSGDSSEFSGGSDEDLTGRPAFLYRSGEKAAITLDSSGQNLPDSSTGWKLDGYFTLGARDADPADPTAEEMIRGIRADGYFVWSTRPTGRGQ